MAVQLNVEELRNIQSSIIEECKKIAGNNPELFRICVEKGVHAALREVQKGKAMHEVIKKIKEEVKETIEEMKRQILERHFGPGGPLGLRIRRAIEGILFGPHRRRIQFGRKLHEAILEQLQRLGLKIGLKPAGQS